MLSRRYLSWVLFWVETEAVRLLASTYCSSEFSRAPVRLACYRVSRSEAKEALAHYPEILREIKLAIQEAGRMLSRYTARKARYTDELKKRSYIERYIPHVAGALKELLNLKAADIEELQKDLKEILERRRGQLKEIKAENIEYDEEFAKIGSEEEHGSAGDGAESDEDADTTP